MAVNLAGRGLAEQTKTAAKCPIDASTPQCSASAAGQQHLQLPLLHAVARQPLQLSNLPGLEAAEPMALQEADSDDSSILPLPNLPPLSYLICSLSA